MSIVSLDLETTGLDERVHEAWEVALVTEGGEETCYQFPLRKPMKYASLEALRIGGFVDRYQCQGKSDAYQEGSSTRFAESTAAHHLRVRTDGATLMGCAIQFDMRFLAELLRAHGQEPSWHHRGLDLGSYAAGAVGEPEPLRSADMAKRFARNDEAHTALGDARWNWQVYRYLQERPRWHR